jgi:fructose-bisphosphate aldolase class I
VNEKQLEQMAHGRGFIAALDQSGGSTPKALRLYGIPDDAYSTEEQMFDLVHQMRTRIITSPAFSGKRVIGCILFEQTMDREIEGRGTADYLWHAKHVVPFLKVDKGLADEADGVQLMKPMPGLADLLSRAVEKGVFGTKMRSVITTADPDGIQAVVDQQFEIAHQILDAGLMPIVEPEVDIRSESKALAEKLLLSALTTHIDALPEGRQVMLKLTLPTTADFYTELMAHPKVLRVVALSGGYSREQADLLLRENHGMTASFSRALTEGLTAQQSDGEFDQMLEESIQSIYEASMT